MDSNTSDTDLSHTREGLVVLLKAAADALRTDVLRVLRYESFGVLELCRIFDVSQPGMSHHLKILQSAGLLEARREGTSIFYRRAFIPANNPYKTLLHELLSAVDALDLNAETAERVALIHAERASHSRDFFARHAATIRSNQDMIARFDQYGESLLDLIGGEATSRRRVLEVGPGDSELLGQLADRFDTAVALDNSPDMLAAARARAGAHDNICFRLGEMRDLKGSFDAVVLNMVMHHLPSPGQFFLETRHLLGPGGLLAVADLCPHDQHWAREVCGDTWLGLAPLALDQWALEANLEPGQSLYLGMKNGFQVQLRTFHRQP